MVKIITISFLAYFFVLNPLVIYWVKQMEDIWLVKFIFGKMGVGKTGLIAKLSMKDLQDPQIKQVYTTIGVPGTYKFDFKEVVENKKTFPPYSSVYVDEFGLVYNSRDFKKFPEQARKWMKYVRQSRIKLTMFSQAPDIDKAIRDLCHSYSLLRRLGPFVFEIQVNKNIDVGTDNDGNGQLIDNYAKLGLLQIHIHYLPRYFDLWKSFDPPAWEYCQADLVPITPELVRAFSFRKFYRNNFRVVYDRLCSRVSAAGRSLSHHFVNTIRVTYKDFCKLQYLRLYEIDSTLSRID